ncbi:DUF805 domain-containing protein [Actinomyces bowdenii]|uniref:DUF805 domain-containing protein n=1 Tax=Actinomyces bowdenii TaxID=131109 RepID=A0A853EN44_9ACTO|nr:DUF805 domain-containing protein [Actinomyces bowdenii]MBF0697737.1 DUF805 domain-containing protein [Actinomyces bowdenii]NYS69910.1 DUF805 domain-containing protein [Actinomyces bowdenii]
MSYGNTPDPYGAQPQQGYPQQPGGFPGQPGGMPGGYGAGGYQFGAPALSPEVAPLPGASIGDAVKRFFQRYAQFRGYASQSEYWWVQLFLVILQVIGYIMVIGPLMAAAVATSEDPTVAESSAAALGAGTVVFALIFFVVFLALIIPSLSLSVRRLHDAGYSGWMVLLMFVPYAGAIAPIVFGLLPSKPENYRPEWS